MLSSYDTTLPVSGPGGVGASAYQDWLTLPGNAGKSKEDFLASYGAAGGVSPTDLALAVGSKLDATGDASLTSVALADGTTLKLPNAFAGRMPAVIRRYGTLDRPAQTALKEVVITPADLGVSGDATADAAPALQNACNDYAGRGGARIRLPLKYLIDTPLTLKNTITLAADSALSGTIARFLTTAAQRAKTYGEGGAIKRDNPYGDVQRIYTDPNLVANSLVINPAVTITVGTGSGLSGLMLLRKGMPSVPQGGNSPANTGSETFAGVAVTGNGDNVLLNDLFVLGFDHVFKSSGFQQIRTARIVFDCLNGFWVDDCQDVSLFVSWHGFPFATIASGTAYLTRPGYLGKVTNSVDWSDWVTCFGYGFKTPYRVENSQAARFLDCAADSVPGALVGVADAQVMQSAFTILNSDTVRIVGGHVSGNPLHAVDMNIAEYGTTQHNVSVTGLNAGTLSGSVYNVQSGSLSVTGGLVAAAPVVLRTQLATSRVQMTGVTMRQITDVPFDLADTAQLSWDGLGLMDWPESRSPYRKTPPSGDRAILYRREAVAVANLSAGWRQGRVATITVTAPTDGSGGIGTMYGGYPGRVAYLYAVNPFTLYGGDTSGNGFAFAAGGSSLAVSAGTWLCFAHDGSVWRQVKL